MEDAEGVPGLAEDLYRRLNEKMAALFPPSSTGKSAPEKYNDADIHEIASLLELMGRPAWSRVT
jgi:hypothetical protein